MNFVLSFFAEQRLEKRKYHREEGGSVKYETNGHEFWEIDFENRSHIENKIKPGPPQLSPIHVLQIKNDNQLVDRAAQLV